MANYIKLSPNDQSLLRSVSCAVRSLSTVLSAPINIETGILAPTLPYIIPDNVFHSYTIITTGVISIDGVAVVDGAYSYGGGTNDLLTGKTITGSGSVVITTQKKV